MSAITDTTETEPHDSYRIEIDGRVYRPIPERWIEAGVDASDRDGLPTLLAVSYSGDRESKALIIRYLHPRRPGLIHSSTGREVVDGAVQPAGLDQGRWFRSVTPAPDQQPTDHARVAELRHLRALWGDRVDGVPTEEVLEAMLTDGGVQTLLTGGFDDE